MNKHTVSADIRNSENVLWNRAYLFLAVASFFAWLSYNMVTPVLTGYLKTLGASLEVCGFVGGLFAGASLLTRPFSGVFADRFNRKNLNFIFTLVMTVSLLIYALIPNMAVIEIFRTLHGVAFGFSSTASLVLVSEVVSPSHMGEAISYYSVMSVASMTVGPSLGVWISSRMGYRAVFLAGVVFLAAASVLCALVPYQRPVRHAVRETAGRNAGTKRSIISRVIVPEILDLSAENASFTFMNGVVAAFVLEFANEEGIPGISIYFIVNALALVIFRIFLSKRLNTWTLRRVMLISYVTAVLSLVLLFAARTLPVMIAAAILKAVGQGMSMPALQSEAFRSVSDDRRGLASGTIYIGGDAGQALGPLAGGVLAAALGMRRMFLLSALPMCVTFIWFMMSDRSGRKKSG